MSRRTLPEDWDGLGDPPKSLELVWKPSGRSDTGRGTSGRSRTGQWTLGEVQDGSGVLGEDWDG